VKLTHRLLAGSAVVVSVLLAVVLLVVDRRLHARVADEAREQLTREARLLAAQWASGADPDALADTAGAALGHRVTLIDPEGRVVGDSEFDGPALAALESHRTRPEVARALTDGVASARRRSPSAGDEELYVAVRAARGVARVSVTTRDVDDLFARARRDVLVAGGMAMVVALALAALFSREVSRPVAELRDVAQSLAAGDLSRRPALSAPGEVGDLATAVRGLAEQLEARLAALQAEKELTAAVIDALTEGVVAVDQQQHVVRANAVARRLLRLRESVPFPVDHLPWDAELRAALGAALRGAPSPSHEVELYGRVLAVTARPLAGGGAVLALLDLTRLRRLEAVRSDFVANVSHELKTPLTVVAGFAETLAEDDLAPEQRRRFAESVRAHAARMQRIVDDLLDLSRIESGGWRPNPGPVPVREAALEATAAVQGGAAGKGVTIEVAPDEDAASVHADATAVRQIVSNLVENAVRHTPAGGRVTVYARRGDGGVWLGVRDTGSGIPAQHLPRIFERFYRADPGRSREAGGTGLGLAIVKHLAEAHGGRVHAESEVGQGATVEVLFPDASG
jgi:two-component system, OmpR family, phosphate regulon sensor histidine kinase PhoR